MRLTTCLIALATLAPILPGGARAEDDRDWDEQGVRSEAEGRPSVPAPEERRDALGPYPRSAPAPRPYAGPRHHRVRPRVGWGWGLTSMLAKPGGEADALLHRIAEAESQAATIASRLAQLEREITSHDGMTIDLEHLKTALAEFDGIWDVLLPHEKGQLICSLVQRVVCSPGGEIQVIFRTDK